MNRWNGSRNIEWNVLIGKATIQNRRRWNTGTRIDKLELAWTTSRRSNRGIQRFGEHVKRLNLKMDIVVENVIGQGNVFTLKTIEAKFGGGYCVWRFVWYNPARRVRFRRVRRVMRKKEKGRENDDE